MGDIPDSGLSTGVVSDAAVLEDDLDMGVHESSTSLDPQIVAMLRFEGREQAGRRNVEGAGKADRKIKQGKLLMNQGCTPGQPRISQINLPLNPYWGPSNFNETTLNRNSHGRVLTEHIPCEPPPPPPCQPSRSLRFLYLERLGD